MSDTFGDTFDAFDDDAAVVAQDQEVQLFGKWSTNDVIVSDISLGDYVAVKDKYSRYLPHSGGRFNKKRFRKAQCPIVNVWLIH